MAFVVAHRGRVAVVGQTPAHHVASPGRLHLPPRRPGAGVRLHPRTQTSPITGVSAIQAATDSGGASTKISDGVYEYRFNAKRPPLRSTATHTVGAYASRDLSEFELRNSLAAKTFNWVRRLSGDRNPAVTSNQKCDSCHGTPLVFHGSRTTVEVCILCHTPQTTDPDTGNTVDFTTMVHKIHQGSGLPSVVAGKPYVIIGNNQSVHDYSTVVFPADVRNCAVCHLEGATGNQHLTNPSRRACGSCHDDVNFATGENHAALPQVSDNHAVSAMFPKVSWNSTFRSRAPIPLKGSPSLYPASNSRSSVFRIRRRVKAQPSHSV